MRRSPRSRILRLASAVLAGLATQAEAQVPAALPPPCPPTGPAPEAPPGRVGPLRRAVRHVGFTLHDRFIGYPEAFAVPPLGTSIGETFGVMRAKADTHRFILYHSDFVEGSAVLTPAGAQRLSLMAARLPKWLGPVVVEWTPDRPGLDASRRVAVLAQLQGAGLPVVDERVIVGPSPYPGLPGPDAVDNHENLIYRDQQAARRYSLTPSSTAIFGGGAR